MVYCGKPSKACAQCRQRRTKCDTLKPSCSQCQRAGRVCNGYRDPSDLRIRDESESLRTRRERKAGPKKASSSSKAGSSTVVKSKPPPTASTDLVNPALLREPEQTPRCNLPSLELGTPTEDQATCFFFRNYVLGDYKYGGGDFKCLPDIYANEEVGPALSQCIVAVGMVGLSHFWGAANLLSQAQAKYNSTLRLVSSLLRTVDGARADQTLIAVMLLGLYEVNTCNSRQSMKSWTKHISGATALLNFRGKQQLQTAIGHQLFLHLRFQVIANCIQRHVPIPTPIREWSNIALEFETPEQAALTSLSALAIKYSDIRSSMCSFKDYSNSETIIPALVALDAEYADWASTCPPAFVYSTVNLLERSDEVFSDHYHVYTSLWIAKAWNAYRSVRILVNELLVDQLNNLLQSPKPSLSDDESTITTLGNHIRASKSMVLQLSHDICASVPYCLGYDGALDRAFREPPKSASGNLLLWPLYSAAVTRMVSPMMRDWVAGRLMLIAEVVGVKLAIPLVQSLMTERDIVDWQLEETSSIKDTPLPSKALTLRTSGRSV